MLIDPRLLAEFRAAVASGVRRGWVKFPPPLLPEPRRPHRAKRKKTPAALEVQP